MPDLLPDLAAVVASRGVFLRREALAAGYDDVSIQRFTSRGDWVRVRPGAYAERARWAALDARGRYLLRVQARAAAARKRGIHSHVTSAVLHGAPLWSLPLSDVHVTHATGAAGRRETGVHHHRSVVRTQDVVVTSGLPHTSAARTILEIYALCGLDAAVTVGNDLLHRRVVRAAQVAAFAEEAKQWPGTLAAELLLRTLDERIESVAESRFVLLCRRAGVAGLVPQYEVRDGSRLVGRVDFAIPHLGVFFEIDGRGKYFALRRPGESADDVLWREKTRQERIAACTGWECIRITWSDLENPHETVRRIYAALERGRARMAAFKPFAG